MDENPGPSMSGLPVVYPKTAVSRVGVRPFGGPDRAALPFLSGLRKHIRSNTLSRSRFSPHPRPRRQNTVAITELITNAASGGPLPRTRVPTPPWRLSVVADTPPDRTRQVGGRARGGRVRGPSLWTASDCQHYPVTGLVAAHFIEGPVYFRKRHALNPGRDSVACREVEHLTDRGATADGASADRLLPCDERRWRNVQGPWRGAHKAKHALGTQEPHLDRPIQLRRYRGQQEVERSDGTLHLTGVATQSEVIGAEFPGFPFLLRCR